MTLKPQMLLLVMPTDDHDELTEFCKFVGAELSHEGLRFDNGSWQVLPHNEGGSTVRITVRPEPGLNVNDAVRRALQDAPLTPVSWRLAEPVATTHEYEVQHG